MQKGLSSPRTPSGSVTRRVRMVLGVRSPHHVRSGRTRLVLWVSSRLPLSRSTIWTTGSYSDYLTRVAHSISRFRPPPHIRLFNRAVHGSHTIIIIHPYLSFPSVFVLLGGMYSYVRVYCGGTRQSMLVKTWSCVRGGPICVI